MENKEDYIMANYNCTFRTNYFKVKDNEKFEEFMAHVYAEDLEVFHKTDKNGNELYGFGGYGGISGYFNNENEYEDSDEAWDNAYDNLIDGLAKQVAENDAILLFEVGNEKLRYVVGSVAVITSKGYKYRDITNVGVEIARQMLNNPNYDTRCAY